MGVLPVFGYASELGGVERASTLGRRLGTRRVRLDILDYSSEWLLDLPMAGQGFAAWSAHTLALLREPPRRACFDASPHHLEGMRPNDRADDSRIHRGHPDCDLLACGMRRSFAVWLYRLADVTAEACCPVSG